MVNPDSSRASSGKAFWSIGEVVKGDIAGLLPHLKCLPVQHWKPGMFFAGASDKALGKLTGGRFPATTSPGKTHPVYCLDILPDGIGAVACPCTSRSPLDEQNRRFIRKGCRLTHTGHLLDRDSHLIESARLPVPPSIAGRLHFRGKVPDECIKERV